MTTVLLDNRLVVLGMGVQMMEVSVWMEKRETLVWIGERKGLMEMMGWLSYVHITVPVSQSPRRLFLHYLLLMVLPCQKQFWLTLYPSLFPLMPSSLLWIVNPCFHLKNLFSKNTLCLLPYCLWFLCLLNGISRRNPNLMQKLVHAQMRQPSEQQWIGKFLAHRTWAPFSNVTSLLGRNP